MRDTKPPFLDFHQSHLTKCIRKHLRFEFIINPNFAQKLESMMQFNNKIVLITGAGSGIGRETALAFAKLGGTIVVADRNVEGGHKTVEAIQALGREAVFIRTNVARWADVKEMIDKTIQHFGRIDIAINNAGIIGIQAKTVDSPLGNWEQVMSVNASGVFYCMKFQIEEMLKQGAGIIVNISSIAGLRGLPNHIAYSASKHAVIGMTKTAAMEYAKYNIRVNAICPVFTKTPLFDVDAMEKASEGITNKLRASIPMRRFAEASEIASQILWFCSENAGFITGVALPVDGGMTA